MIDTKEKYIEITNNWINNKRKKGKVKIAKYYIYNNIKYSIDSKYVILDYTLKEKEVAIWLTNTFGGTLYILPRINFPKNIKTPDYIFKNEKWDLKALGKEAISNTRAVDNIIKKSKNQTDNIILDITNTSIDKESIISQTKKVFTTSGREWLQKIMIIDNYKLIKIYQRK